MMADAPWLAELKRKARELRDKRAKQGLWTEEELDAYEQEVLRKFVHATIADTLR